MKHPKRSLNIALLTIFSLLTAVLLTGCFADEPPKDHVRNVLEPALTRNAPLEILKLESKWIKTGEVTWEGKAEVRLRLKEDCYISASLNDELAVLKLDHAETSALRQALYLVAVQAEPMRSSLLEKAPKSLEAQNFITLSEKAGAPLSATFSLVARAF